MESRFSDLRFNDIPGIMIAIRFPGKSYSKVYGTEPQFNDLRFNDIRGLTRDRGVGGGGGQEGAGGGGMCPQYF